MSFPPGFSEQQKRMQEQQRRMQEQALQDQLRRQKYAWYTSRQQNNARIKFKPITSERSTIKKVFSNSESEKLLGAKVQNPKDSGMPTVTHKIETENKQVEAERKITSEILLLLGQNKERLYSFQEMSDILNIQRPPLQHTLVGLHEQKKIKITILEGTPYASMK